MNIDRARENELTLARLLGISEDEASERLSQTFAITANAEDGATTTLAANLHQILSRTLKLASNGERPDVEIVLAGDAACGAAHCVFVRLSDTEVGAFNSPPAQIAGVHALLLSIAACYIAGRAIAVAVGHGANAERSLQVSFTNLGIDNNLLGRPFYLDRPVLIGAGAIGNGFLWALRTMAVSGSLVVADPKKVGSGNPNRCLYFDEHSIGYDKAEVLCANAQHDLPDLDLIPFVGTFHEYLKGKSDHRARRVIVATDSRRVRRSIQKELPLEVIDGSTTGAEEVIVHSHRQPTDHACLACIYRHIEVENAREQDIASGLGVSIDDVRLQFIDERVAALLAEKHPRLDGQALVGTAYDTLFRQLCAQQALLSATGEQVFAPFAFISCLAGALMVVEMLRLDSGLPSTSNYFFTDPWQRPTRRARSMHPRATGCEFCSRPAAREAMARVWSDVLG